MTDYLTPAQVAETLQVSPRTVQRLAARGDLPALRVGKLVRIGRQALTAWQRRHEINVPEGERATDGASAPAAAHRAPLTLGALPAGYQPVYGVNGDKLAAPPAARRSGSAKGKKKAV